MDSDLLSPPNSARNFNDRHGRRDSDHYAPDSPPAPYDPPSGHYDGGDIAMQQLEDPPSSATYSAHTTSPMLGDKSGDYGRLSNYTFDSDTRSLLSTAKRYDHHESRLFLLKTGSYRFLITLLFSVLMGVSLKAYEGFGKPYIMNRTEVRVFNSIMLALSLGLGLNLASSLKRYAVILRWSLLTKRYVSLEVFDLILGLETLTKVGKLMVISLPGVRRIKFLKKLPWFREARDDGTRLTWLVCLIWIFINIGAQILVAALSLFWPVDPSDGNPLLTYGNVIVADLTHWKIDAPDPENDGDKNATSMEASWMYGMEAQVYPTFALDDQQNDLSSLAGTPLYQGDGYYEYRFFNRDPEHQFTNYLVSARSVQARTTCIQVDLKGTLIDTDEFMGIEGRVGNGPYTNYTLMERAGGSITWIGSKWSYCGPRCTNFTVYQDDDGVGIKQPSLFLCNSTLSDVMGGETDFTNLKKEERDHVYGSDEFARIAAGSMCWTGIEWNGWTDRQARSYLKGSKWSPYKVITKDEVEDLLSRFTIGAVAAFDDHGLRYNVTNQNTRPVQGQQLTVDWPYVLSLLGGICLIQFGALMCLITFANKSIIRDESFFSLAMLLSPVVNRIGKAGMNLSGDEIKSHPKLLWKRIRYDYREGKDGEPNQVDIFFQGKDNAESRRSWAPGVYS